MLFSYNQKTLAYRYQCRALSELLEAGNETELNTSEYFDLDELDEDLVNLISMEIKLSSSSVEISEKLSINSIQYRTGTFVLLDLSEQGFLFGEIICSVRDDPKFPFLVVKCYRTDVFDDNSFCHRVIQTVPFETRICALSDLLDYHPLDGLCIDGHINIRMKHFVMKPEETLFPL